MDNKNTTRALAKNIGNEKFSILTMRPWELFGFGCHHAWLLSIILGSTIYSFSALSEPAATTRFALLLGIVAGYLFIFFGQHTFHLSNFSRGSIFAAGVSGTIGTALVIVPFDGAAGILILIIAALLMGICSATLMTAGNKFWANNRPERAMMQLTASSIAAVAVYYFLAFIPFEIAIPLICALPLAGGIILAVSKGGKQRVSTYRKMPQLDKATNIRLLIHAFTFALVSGCVFGTMALPDFHQAVSVSNRALIGAVVVVLFSFVVALRARPAGMLKTIDKPIEAIFIIGLALFAAFPAQEFSIYQVLIVGGYILVDQFLWLLNSDLAFRTQEPSAAILARSCLCQWTGFALGFLAGCSVHGYQFTPFFIPIEILGITCLIVFTIVRTFVFSHNDAIRIVEARSTLVGEETLQDRCDILAEQYALSARESEILFLLARGRSGPYIQDELSLSQSTIKTHTRNLYRKFGVASRQELLDMIEKES